MVGVSLPLYRIAAEAVREKTVIEFGLCAKCVRRRVQSRRAAYLIALAVVLTTTIAAYAKLDDRVLAGVAVAFVLVVMIMTVLIWEYVTEDVSAARITEDHLWLKGASSEFLEEFPPFPGVD